jgi:predicted nucleic acid-binding protein
VILGATSICELSDRHRHYFRSSERRSLQSTRSAWYASIADEDIFLSTLVLGEIRKGVELARPRDAGKAAVLERWLREIELAFDGRVLGIDNMVSD